MTPQEFKAWFDGFTEAFSGVPTKAQWTRIKERVGEIDGKAVTERVFVDRYVPNYPYWYRWYGVNGQPFAAYCASNNMATTPIGKETVTLSVGAAGGSQAAYCSTTAMNAIGRADAQALAA